MAGVPALGGESVRQAISLLVTVLCVSVQYVDVCVYRTTMLCSMWYGCSCVRVRMCRICPRKRKLP